MLTWTKQVPVEPGWYWMRCNYGDEREPRIARVRDYAGDLAIGNSHLRGWTSLERYEWAGPIPLPGDTLAVRGGSPPPRRRHDMIKKRKSAAGFRTSPPPCSPVPVGWQCPRCGKGLAPWMPECNCHITIVVNPPVMPYHTPGTGDPLPVPTITVCDTANTHHEPPAHRG